MRKTAQRKLKAQFKHDTGREAAKMTIVHLDPDSGMTAYVPSTWRRLKKQYHRKEQ